jgi:BTB/POZ domain
MSQINSTPLPPPVLQEATKNSTSVWQENLEELFRNAKDRFPDVVWEVGEVCGGDMMKDVEMDVGGRVEEVWGHKGSLLFFFFVCFLFTFFFCAAIVYARAPPSFQTRYFSFRQAITLPTGEYTDDSDFIQPHASSPSPSPSTTTTAISQQQQQQPPTTSLLRLTSSINSALFSNELEYLYTGKGFGEAFEFLFDSSESSSRDRHLRGVDDDEDDDDADPEALRIDKLRKDLVFMWRSRLYSDVRIALTGNFSSSSSAPGDTTTAIFSSHRFILVSRSPYFHDALSWNPTNKQQPGDEPPTLNLPSPPFTPASLHFTLGFMYTGTLIFSHRSYDLSTAFAILRAALYLSLNSLHDEIQARIVQEMLHGLYHAFIPFEEYERLTNGKWGTGGCRCRQCARRVPRVLEFALAEDVQNRYLESGSRRALVGLFGEGWVHQEFSSLPLKIRESLLRGLAKRTRPLNVFPLLFAAEHGLGKLGVVIEPWGDISREMIMSARKTIDEVLCKESEACFNSEEWMELMECDGVKFEDGEKVEWAMAAVLRGVKDAYAASLYQVNVFLYLNLSNFD